MPDIQVVSKETFTSKRWKKVDSYTFMSGDTLCPITMQEVPKAMFQMPIGFAEVESGYGLVTLLGLRPHQNVFVGSDGRWLSSYMPAILRSYPFLLAREENTEGRLLFCIDADSGLVSADESDEPYFDEEGQLSEQLKGILSLLEAVHTNRLATERICKTLDEMGLLKPWNIQVELDGSPFHIDGLFCIDETALNKLDDDDYLTLRECNALPIAYCQMLSMQRVPDLALRSQAISGSEVAPRTEEISFDSFADDGNLNLDNL